MKVKENYTENNNLKNVQAATLSIFVLYFFILFFKGLTGSKTLE